MLASLGKKLHIWKIRRSEIPKHVAFIMDGNRRWSNNLNKKVIEGHESGFDSLKNIMNICFDLKIYNVTIYAFSVDNFGRSEEEVEGLMKLAEKAVKLFSDEMF
jgi:ditrans,polycis-polyprenyl diphosphate synthase